MIILQRTGTVA